MEYAKNGELYDLLADIPLQEEFSWNVFTQLLDALQYLHNKGFSHWDLKLENILLDEDWNIKITDYDFCTDCSTSTT